MFGTAFVLRCQRGLSAICDIYVRCSDYLYIPEKALVYKLSFFIEEVYIVADGFSRACYFNAEYISAVAGMQITRLENDTAFLTVSIIVYIKFTIGVFLREIPDLAVRESCKRHFYFLFI